MHARTQRVNRHMVGRITEAHDPPHPHPLADKVLMFGNLHGREFWEKMSIKSNCFWSYLWRRHNGDIWMDEQYFICGAEHWGGGAWERRNIHELLLWGESQGCVTEKGDRCSRKMFDARQPCLFNRLTRSSFGGLISTPQFQTEPADKKRQIRVTTCRPVAWSVTHVGCRGDDSLMRTRGSVLILCVTIWYLLGHGLRPCFVLPVSFLPFPSPF